ncbi:MAG TPA: ankyrin repeat domain-containing protein [Gammaproteobacteria bacterium]|nr:ankyrin repeat domain-containing protein [Gammaproteobacteria bacterium]
MYKNIFPLLSSLNHDIQLNSKQNPQKDIPIILDNDTIDSFSKDVSYPDSIQPLTDIKAFLSHLNNLTSSPPATEQNTHHPVQYPVHHAAATGNIELLQSYLMQGYDIDIQDKYHSTPLQVAVFHGQLETVQWLLQNGADVNATCYQNNTALHIALLENQTAVVATLLDFGANPVSLNDNDESPILLSLERIVSLSDLPVTYEYMLQNELNTFITLCEALDGPPIFEDYDDTDNTLEPDFLPISIILEWVASSVSDPTMRTHILTTADIIDQNDPYHIFDKYIATKALLHAFPNDKTYSLTLSNGQELYVHSEGFSSLFTTAIAKDAIQAFLDQLNVADDPIKTSVFSSLASTLNYGVTLAQQSDDLALCEEALLKFNAGETILLPTGWNGHAVDVILNKPHQLFIVCNAGQRFSEDPPGSKFYTLSHLDKIDADLIHDILSNEDQYVMEYKNTYLLGLDEVYDIEYPKQEFGNCAWHSQKVAVSALIFLDLLDQGFDTHEAYAKTENYYNEWESFQSDYILHQYVAQVPELETQALIDILWNYMDLSDPHHFEQAKFLIDTLLSENYYEDFSDYIENNWQFKVTFAPLLEAYSPPGSNTSDDTFLKFNDHVLDITPLHQIHETHETHETSEHHPLHLNDVLSNPNNSLDGHFDNAFEPTSVAELSDSSNLADDASFYETLSPFNPMLDLETVPLGWADV